MERLFIYGSLQPGGPNEHVMNAIGGEWQPATVKGRLVEKGWGAQIGYPGLVLDQNGSDIAGHVFSSANLSAKWPDLDTFEGAEYERTVARASLQSGERIPVHVYVLRRA